MESRTLVKSLPIAFVSFAAAALLIAGCGSGSVVSSSTGTPPTETGPAFVVGTDAPLASVLSFAVPVESINAITAGGTSVPLLSGTPTVILPASTDFKPCWT